MNGNCLTSSRNRRLYCYKSNYVLFSLAHYTIKCGYRLSSQSELYQGSLCMRFISSYRSTFLKAGTTYSKQNVQFFGKVLMFYNIACRIKHLHVSCTGPSGKCNFFFLLRQQMSFCGAFITFRLNITSRKWNRYCVIIHCADSV